MKLTELKGKDIMYIGNLAESEWKGILEACGVSGITTAQRDEGETDCGYVSRVVAGMEGRVVVYVLKEVRSLGADPFDAVLAQIAREVSHGNVVIL